MHPDTTPPQSITREHLISPGAAEVDRRIASSRRRAVDLGRVLEEARVAIADELGSDIQFGDDLAAAEAGHRKWQLIHRFVLLSPFADDETTSRPAQWQRALSRIRPLDDLDLIEWVSAQVDAAFTRAARDKGLASGPGKSEPTYLALLRYVAGRKRQARAQVRWLLEARSNGWGTCTSDTLGRNVLNLHAASVHSRDNPDYTGPCDGAYRKE